MDRNGLAGDHRGAMRITLFILAVLLAVGARAQIQQNHFTTNKVSSGTGLTNVFTGTNALGARIYQLRMDVAAGPGVTLSTNGSQITFTAALRANRRKRLQCGFRQRSRTSRWSSLVIEI